MRVRVFVEGGGDRNEQQIRCREAFRQLAEKAGLVGRMPAFVACGSRNDAFKDFCASLANMQSDSCPLLLVDSEEPVEDPASDSGVPLDSAVPWGHLADRDGWAKPSGATNDQALLMATCMETWIMADHATLKAVFGDKLLGSALLPPEHLEHRARHEVQQALEHATSNCGDDKQYRKGRRSFEVLSRIRPTTLSEHLPHFRRFVAVLHHHLD